METTELLKSAITKIRLKNTPVDVETPQQFIPEDAYKGLFPILECFDKDKSDPDIQTKTKFIYDFLSGGELTPRDRIMSILNELPVVSQEPTINRIWKYCRIKDERNRVIKRAEVLNQRLRNI